MKITLLYQVSHYIRVKKQRNIKSWDHLNHLVIRGVCYIRPLYNEAPLYNIFCSIISMSPTFVQDPLFFQSFIQEKLSMYCHPIVGVSFSAGWLLLHFWEGEAFAVDVTALSPIPRQLLQSPGTKLAGGTPDNVNKWSIIYCAKELLSDHTILKVRIESHRPVQ